MGEARENAWRLAERASTATVAQTRLAARQAGDYLQAHPLALIALGLASGTLLAAMVPESRAENRMMGETSDDAKARARALMDEQMERGRRMAAAARDAAVGEAEKQGLSGEGIRREGEEVRHKVERVAQWGSHVLMRATGASDNAVECWYEGVTRVYLTGCAPVP